MPEENSSATYHLSELDFDISKIPNQLQEIDDLLSQFTQQYQNQFSNINFNLGTDGTVQTVEEIRRAFNGVIDDITSQQNVVADFFSKEDIDRAKNSLIDLLSVKGEVSKIKIFTDDDNQTLRAMVTTTDSFGNSINETFSLVNKNVGKAKDGVQEYEKIWKRTSSIITESIETQAERTEKVLKRQQALQAATAKEAENYEKKLSSLIERQKDATARYSTGKYSSNSNLKKQSQELERQLSILLQTIKANREITDEQKEQIDNLVAQSRELNRQGNSINVPTVETSWIDKLKQVFAFDLVNEAEKAVRFTVETLKDVELEVMEITRVLGDATLNTKEYTQSLFDIATEYGRQFSDVTEVTLRFAQSGYSAAESLELAKTTMLALNTAELSVEQSTNSLIGIMKQWGVQTEDFSLIVDKINLAADSFAVTSQDLVDGLLRSSSAAANAKFSFDQTIGALVAMRETSGRTGKEVGTAMNSLITYTQRAKSLAVFEDLGVQVYADETKETLMPVLSIWESLSKLVHENGDAVVTTLEKYTDMSNLMSKEVAAATGTLDEYDEAIAAQQELTKEGLSDMERQAIYEQAGTHRRNYFIALLKNFSRVQEVVNTLQDAEGHSLQENAKYMDTLTARYNQFLTTLQELAKTAGDSGFMDLAKDILSIGTAMAKFGDNFASVPMITAGVTALFGVLRKEGKATQTIFGKTINTWDDFISVLGSGKSNVSGFVQELIGMDAAQIKAQASSALLKISTLALNAGMAALASIIVTKVISAIAYLINYSENVKKEFEEVTTSLKQAKSEFQSNAATVELLKQEYADLAQGVDRFGKNQSLSNEDYKQFLENSNKLAEIFPQLVLGTDEYGNAILDLDGDAKQITDTIDLLLEQLGETNRLEILAGADEAFEKFNRFVADSEKQIDKLEKKEKELDGLRDNLSVWNEKLFPDAESAYNYMGILDDLGVHYEKIVQTSGDGIGYKVFVDERSLDVAEQTIKNSIKLYETEIQMSFAKLNPVVQATIEGHVGFAGLEDEAQQLFKEIISNMTFSTNEELENWVNRMVLQFQDATPAMQAAIADLFSLEEAVKNGEITTDAYKESIVMVLEKLKDLIPDDVFSDLLGSYLSVADSIESAAEDTADKVQTLKDLAVEQIADIETEIKNLNSEIDNIQSSFQTLADVVGEYNSQGYVSIDTLQKLISLSPNYLSLLSEENGVLSYNEDAYKRVIAAEIEKMRVDSLNKIAQQISDINNESAALAILEGEYLAAASSAQDLTSAILSNIAALEQQGTVSEGTAQRLVNYINNINKVFDKARDAQENYKAPVYTPAVSSGGSGKSWYDSQVEAFERLNRMGQKNTKQVVDFYRQMTKSANVSAADRIKAEEKLFDAIKKQIQESLKLKLEALNKQKEAVSQRAEEQVDELNDRKQQIQDEAQAEIDSIRKVQDERDRQRDHEEYQRKLSEAKIDLESAQRRSGIDARRAEKEALDKIDDINREWQEKVEDWQIDDRIAEIERYRDAQISSIESQIEAIQEQKEADIEAIDEAIEHLNEQFSEANINMMAYASMTSEQLYNQYVGEFVEPMANGLYDGFVQANDLMESAAVSNASNLANIYRSEFINPMTEEIANLNAQVSDMQLGPYLSDTYQLKSLPTADYSRKQEYRTYNVNMTNNNNVSNQANINRMTKGILKAIGSALSGKP